MIATDDSKKMQHCRKWAMGRNMLMSVMALRIAGFAKECLQLYESVRSGKRIEGDIPLPSLKTWLKLYKNPRRIGNALLNAMQDINGDTAKEVKILKDLNEGAIQLQKNPKIIQDEIKRLTENEWKEINETGNKKMEELFERVIDDLVEDFNKKENDKFKKNFIKPEFIFFFRVMAPCFTIYKTYPLELLKKAKSGDDEALEKLVRLDKSIIFEPKISEIIHQAQALKEQARISMIKTAFTSPPNPLLRMSTIKIHLGGLISYFSIALKQKINAIDIWKLYDAISLDRTDDIDYDLDGINEETFARKILDARKMWNVILLPEKK